MTSEAHPVDVHVGRQVNELRRSAKLSQSDLARALGVTFQQVQKYECGVNRVSASRLWTIAETLDCPIGAFFPPMGVAERLDAAPAKANLAIGRAAARLSDRQQTLILDLISSLGPR